MKRAVKVFAGTYLDSVLQMAGSRAMLDVEGVEWAAAAMATPANLDTLASKGFDRAGPLGSASAEDLFVAVIGADDGVTDKALAEAERRLFAGSAPSGELEADPPRTLEEALDLQAGTNLAVVSVPGEYAALEAHKALTSGLHVLLFSDNVPVEDEVALKDRAVSARRLMMGPGAGTAMLAGTGLGFANVVSRADGSRQGPAHRVGVVAAAGTGAQEAMALLHRWGAGVSHVVGLGGRDLSDAVGGRMAKLALSALRDDPATDAILLVSKPPSEQVAREVVGSAGNKPLVASLVGLAPGLAVPAGVTVCDTLEAGVIETLAAIGLEAPEDLDVELTGGGPEPGSAAAAARAARTAVRGLFSGGTLCYEALVVLTGRLGPVWSNTPLDAAYRVPAPAGAHVCLDLGEEEYTRGRPHPMIDPAARIELLREAGEDSAVAVVLLDVVLGHGSHPDPAAQLAPVCAEIAAAGGPAVVAYVLGTDLDPQGLDRQRAALAEAGCILAPTNASAARAAAAIARP